MASPPNEAITPVERNILSIAVNKLNFVSRYGSGESLTEEETMVFRYWLERGLVRAVENAPFGEIYALNE